MPILRPLTALLLLGTAANAAARSQEVEPLISRPLTLPRGDLDLTLHGTYTNWAAGGTSVDGETLAAGFDYGASDNTQVGLAAAFPINPGASFGSVLGSLAARSRDDIAFRLDVGYERIGLNGNTFPLTDTHIDRFFGGIGVPLRIPIGPNVAFVSGRVGAVQFGHFNNVGSNGLGAYGGATLVTELAADLLVFSAGNKNSPTVIGINLPAGLLLQPDPHLALTLQAGYSAVIQTANGTTASRHLIPIALEAVVSPARLLDLGVRFALDGTVAQTGGGSAPGYFDQRALMFWIGFHV